jgi:hypothetical protein
MLAPFASIAQQISSQQTWRLITPGEEARDNASPQAPASPNLPSPPTIDLVRPDISRPIRNPATIELRFGAAPGRPIDMRTFNATYGALGLNITRRLLDRATVTQNGLSANNVALPPGRHRVTISIADASGKRASRTFNFSVTA